jgi:hypothetical protein
MLYVRRILIGLQERARLLRRFVLAGISTKAKSLSCIDLGLLCTRKHMAQLAQRCYLFLPLGLQFTMHPSHGVMSFLTAHVPMCIFVSQFCISMHYSFWQI